MPGVGLQLTSTMRRRGPSVRRWCAGLRVYLLDMRWSPALVLPFFPLSVLAGKFNDPALRSRHARHAIQARTNSTKFTMADYYQGESFLKWVKS